MQIALTPDVLAVLAVVVVVAGATNGVAGFGFALVGTMVLATVVDPSVAVVVMIVPILAVNVSLAQELSREELGACSRRFGPLMAAALVGTVVGMVVLDSLPSAPLRVGLGAVTLAFVLSAQQAVPFPGFGDVVGREAAERPAAMVAVGGVSGLLFGGTNVGVQLVAYVRSFDVSHGLFVGVVAMVFLGLNAVRVAAAGLLGLYPSATVLLVSVAAVVPAVAGVALGKRLRSHVGERTRRLAVLGMLTAVGVRLVVGGLGIA
jgi:uncharacterized membrane protein YfcA